jgi:hypothetical protein
MPKANKFLTLNVQTCALNTTIYGGSEAGDNPVCPGTGRQTGTRRLTLVEAARGNEDFLALLQDKRSRNVLVLQ